MFRLRLLIPAAAALALCACSSGGDTSAPADAIVSVGPQVLTASRVKAEIPAGLTPDDSLAMAKAYIRAWVDRMLVEHVAADEIDMAEIDRLTADYRSELIMASYRRAMAARTDTYFPDDSLRAYYDAHKSDFLLERPLIKGVYLKVPDDAPNLRTIRQLYKSERPVDIDRLEKAALGSAIHYDYFRDSWVDWEQIETRIPLDFTGDNFTRISKRQPVDLTSQGFVYLLSVSDFIPAGTTMPYEAARPLVRERLLAARRRAFDKVLLNDLYERSVADGTVVYNSSTVEP